MNDTYFFKTANDFFYDTQKVSWGFIYSQFRLHLALKPNDLYLNTQFKKFKNCYTSSIERVYEKKQFQTLEELESWVEALKKEKLYEDHLVIVNEESLIVSVSSYFAPVELGIDASDEFLYIFLLQLNFLDEGQAISFMAYQLISRYFDVNNFRKALKKGLQKYSNDLNLDSLHERIITFYIGFNQKEMNTNVQHEEKTNKFTNSQWTLLFHYWLEGFFGSSPRNIIELTSLARFIHLISDKTPLIKPGSSEIYKKLQHSPNFKKDQYLISDLVFIKNLFQKHGITNVVKLIENEINIGRQEKLNKD